MYRFAADNPPWISSWDSGLGNVSNGWFAQTSDFSAAAGDTVSFGLTRQIRQGLGYDDVVNYNSAGYQYGTYAGQVINIGLMVANPAGAAAWAVNGLRAINALSTAGGIAGAAEAAVSGDWTQAGMMLGNVALARLRGAASPCSATSSVASWGLRGMAAAGTGMGVANAYDRIVNQGDWIGGALDLVTAGIGAYRTFAPCFTASTPIVVDHWGQAKLIEEIKVDDLVLARSEHDPNGPLELKRVEDVFVRTGKVVHLHVRGQVIRTTAEHPFYVYNKGWVPAGELEVGEPAIRRRNRRRAAG